METFHITFWAITILIIFVYTIDWGWLIEKVFEMIGGRDEN